MSLALILSACAILAAATLLVWRAADRRADDREAARLRALQPASPALFDPRMVDDLPAPARRYFRFSIAEGTPLRTVGDIAMVGRFVMGERDNPKPMAMRARQVLAAPHGFIWTMAAQRGPMRLSGSDSGSPATSWTRFWMMGLLPVARIGGTRDHRRAAFGRYAAEAVFWTPAALLPGPHAHWEAVDETTARVLVRAGDLEQAVDVTVDEAGRPVKVVFQRWSDANPQKRYRLQPFGGYLSAYRSFGGFTVPTHVEAGNQFGTTDYFPFFIVDVERVDYPSDDCPAG